MSYEPVRNPHSAGWSVQTKISFGVSASSMIVALTYLPVDPWIRAFLVINTLYLVTSTIALAKTVRDEFEAGRVINRVDEVKLERLLAEHDPFKVPHPS